MKTELPALSCPLPITEYETVQLAHGSGGRLSADLIDKVFLPRFRNDILDRLEDQAVLDNPGCRLAISTDSFVIDPIFFPGGDIGDLAINGTVNDICMCGAKPLYICAAFIIEEGFPLESLHRILLSMEAAGRKAGVVVVTGDTKVVPRGACDKLFITTTGLGAVPDGLRLSSGNLQPGDRIILSGTMADHGMAVMTSRENLSFQSRIKSDTAALNSLVENMLQSSASVRTMRDPTRGGVAATLNELARASQVGIKIREEKIPMLPEVKGACELLGIDPLQVANEGKLIAVVGSEAAEALVQEMRKHPLGEHAAIIGEVVAAHPGMVTAETILGASRMIDMPAGEQLPRIC
jgi:hydrogenase expression/formation protein HypE